MGPSRISPTRPEHGQAAQWNPGTLILLETRCWAVGSEGQALPPNRDSTHQIGQAEEAGCGSRMLPAGRLPADRRSDGCNLAQALQGAGQNLADSVKLAYTKSTTCKHKKV